MQTQTGLENEFGQSVALKSVHLTGQLEGLLLTMTVKQRYLNDGPETIEASYTFPAGWGTQLMGLSVELNGQRMQAMALAKNRLKRPTKTRSRAVTPRSCSRSLGWACTPPTWATSNPAKRP